MSTTPSTTPSLLPPASTPLERAIEQTQARFSPPRLVPTLWNAATCPEAFLPYLAWAVSVDEWDSLWSVDKKRAVIAESREIHQRKGTPSAIRRALASIGQPDAEIIERRDFIRCDGSVRADGARTCGGRWATYYVTLFRPITISGAYQVKRLLEAVGRNAVELVAIDFAAAAFRCDGSIRCNGQYSCGSVNTTLS